MNCEFEEKQFEQALNLHLVSDHRLLYAPGQVLENTIGIDVALVTRNRVFWRLFSHVSPWYQRAFGMFPPGVEIQREWWDDLSREIEYFPSFKFNAFIQHKRPWFRNGKRRTAEWQHWQESYYKYELRSHQQEALGNLSERMGAAGVVVYASPAFYKTADLWNANHDGTLVDKTNFAEALRLNGHSSYSYVNGGNSGFAHSKPEPIQSFSFREHIERLAQQPSKLSNKEALIGWGDTVHSTAMESPRIRGTYQVVLYDMLNPRLNELRIAVAFSRISAFCFVTNSNYFIGIGSDTPAK